MVCHTKYRPELLLLYNPFHTLWEPAYLPTVPFALKVQNYDVCRMSNVEMYLFGILLTVIANAVFHVDLVQLFSVCVKLKWRLAILSKSQQNGLPC